jgi:PAS domain S-box-containing protein
MAKPTRRDPAAVPAELAAIIESTHDAIIGLTRQGVITSWNPAAAQLYGYAPEEIVGRAARMLCPEDCPHEEAEVLRRIAEGEEVKQYRTHRRCRDGTVIAVSLTALPVAGPTGGIVGVTTLSRGLGGQPDAGTPNEPRARGELLRAQEDKSQARLQQAQRLENLGQLAGGVAHDFNNLLAVILNYVSFVSEELAAATDEDWALRCETARNDLGQVKRAGERAAGLTRQLLAFARREVIQPQVLDLDNVITAVQEMLHRTLGEHVGLVTSLAGDLWPVLADPGQLEQVLVNLAINARDAMAGGGTLSIDTSNITVDADTVAGGSKSRQGRNVRLRISDTGTGMTREIIEHAFEPFFTTKRDGTGTGLGLATVYGIVTQAGGHVQIYSEPGGGTTFTITLPVTAEATPQLAEPVPYKRPPRGETVLVVEDEAALREVTKRILTRNGYHVITAENGPEALDIARDYPDEIHLLVTDVVMPHMLGREVAERMLMIKPGIQVLFMSGYARPVLASQGRLEPNVALVEKPFSEADLLAKAGQVLDGHFPGFRAVQGTPT